MKKKIFISLLCGFMLLGVATGCNNKEKAEEKKVNVKVLDSKVNYIEIKGKKIYLTRNFRDFALQFKGLGCLVKGEYQEEKEIDDIKKNDPTLTESARTNYITCYNTDEREWTEAINISMHTNTEDQGDINEIYFWQFSSTKGLFNLHINNKKLLFGNEERTPSNSNDVTKIMGTDYEEEPGTYSKYYEYEEDEINYSFRFDEKTNEIEAFSLSIS